MEWEEAKRRERRESRKSCAVQAEEERKSKAAIDLNQFENKCENDLLSCVKILKYILLIPTENFVVN